MEHGPGLLLRMVAAHHDLLDQLDAAKARNKVSAMNYADWIDGSQHERPLPDGPRDELIPGLEAAARTLCAPYPDPKPGVRRWLEQLADHWQHDTPEPPTLPSHLRVMVAESWVSWAARADMDVRTSGPEAGKLHTTGPMKVMFHARLWDGTQIDSSERDTPTDTPSSSEPSGATDAH
ncbi:hypothetical protein [Nonomuraea basaltis]|uniref:hypothetical protein n=1 Tax=Nonomuraea basaltis TaxID=2495887 RepID=UPI00110C6000|nr:hypothetical protein [Nonomuraea basaltis]TMR92581.1 hypothetical protein EJK15_44065 [Nonomuraea basaltis]